MGGARLTLLMVNEGEKWKTSTKVFQRYNLSRCITRQLYHPEPRKDCIPKSTKTRLTLLAFMTLKPFCPTLKLLFLHHNQERVIMSASLNIARLSVCNVIPRPSFNHGGSHIRAVVTEKAPH